jgi:hypothetical protein
MIPIMGKIETLDEAENRLLREQSAEADRVFDGAVRPIYEVVVEGRNPKIKPAGTCILLSVDGHHIMCTAAHVLDVRWKLKREIYVGGASRLVPILNGMIRSTTPPPGSNRGPDRLDCGFWDIPQDAITALGDVDFIDPARLSPNNAPTDRRYYKAMGYRISRNKNLISTPQKSITPGRSGYCGSGSANPELAQTLGVSGDDHLFVNFDPENITDEAGKPANIYSPVGFSGGALVDLGDFTDPTAYSTGSTWRPKLSGILIEHRPKYKAMVAVRIEVIVEGIRSALRLYPSTPCDDCSR